MLLGILALTLYLPGLWWDAPQATAPDRVHSWGVDDEMPLGPLAEIGNIIRPRADRNLGYPLMYSFVVAGAYTPYLGYLWLTGRLRGFDATYPFGLTDPVGTLQILTGIAHLISACMGAGIVLAAYEAGRVLWDRRTGVLAALFAATLFPMFYYARTGNVDVPVLFFTALALAVFAHIMKQGFTVRGAACLGVCIGFALATKETSFASFLAVPLAILILQRGAAGRGKWLSWTFWKAALVGACAAFLAFGFGSGLFVDANRYFAHVAFGSQRLSDLASSDIAFLRGYPYTLTGHFQLAQRLFDYLGDTMTVPGLLLAGLGIILVLRREPRASIFVMPALSYLLVLFWAARVAQLRYVMPAAFTLAFFSARAFTLGWQSRVAAIRIGLAAVVLAILAIGLLRGLDLTYLMINDSRYAAAGWLAAHARPGTHVEFFGDSANLPPLAFGVTAERAIAYEGAASQPHVDQATARQIMAGWRERMPEFVIIMPDLSSPPGVPHNATCPPQIYQALVDGSLGYHLAAYFETPSPLSWIGRPAIDYPSVNPPIRIFARDTVTDVAQRLRQTKDVDP